MPAADTAKLIASLELKDAFSKPLSNANKALAGFDANLTKTEGRAFKAGQQIGTGIRNGAKIAAIGIGLLTTQVLVGLRQLSQLEAATAQTNAGLKSTKDASGQTAASIRNLAEKYENLNAVIDDKVIQSGENVLLTFTNIRKEAFEPALAAALDLSVAMGQDLQQSIVQIGKALNDPAKGFTALRRVGIQFTADQEKQIQALQKSGDLLGAQKIILQELGTEFGGRFAAQGRTAEGAVAGIGDAVEDLQKGLATALFPTIQKLLPRFRELLTSNQFTSAVTNLGQKIASLFSDKNLAEGEKALTTLFNTAKSVAPAIESAAKVTGEVVKTAVDMFKSLPPEIQKLAIAGLAVNKLTGGLVTNLAGGLISAVISSFKGMMNVNAAVVNVNGGVGAAGVPGAALGAAGGASFLATVAGLAAPIAAVVGLQIAGSEAAKQVNLDRGTNFKMPSGFLDIPTSVNNLVEAIKALIKGPPLRVHPVGPFTQAGINAQGGVSGAYGPFAQSGINAQGGMNGGYGPWTTMSDALKSNTSALKGLTVVTKAEADAAYSASAKARGFTYDPKAPASKSLDKRFKFLAGNQTGSKDAAVATALAVHFERQSTPLYRSSKNLEATLKALKADQRQLLTHGDTKNAAIVGSAIDRLKTVVKNKDQKIVVPVSLQSNTYLNGRNLEANLTRYQTVFSSAGNLGGRGPR